MRGLVLDGFGLSRPFAFMAIPRKPRIQNKFASLRFTEEKYGTSTSLNYNGLSKPPGSGLRQVWSAAVSLYSGPQDYLPLSAAFGGRDMLHNIAQCEELLANPATDLHGDLSCSRGAGDLVVPPDAGWPGTSILPMREASSIL